MEFVLGRWGQGRRKRGRRKREDEKRTGENEWMDPGGWRWVSTSRDGETIENRMFLLG